jgi:threonine aldolase
MKKKPGKPTRLPSRSALARRSVAKAAAKAESRVAATATLVALRRELRALATDHAQDSARLTASLTELRHRSTAHTQQTDAEFLRMNDRIRRCEQAQNAIDGREARLSGAIEKALLAADVLNRVELGLRPMLARALETEAAGDSYTDAYDAAHRSFTNSIRS